MNNQPSTALALANFDSATPVTIEASDVSLSLSVNDVLEWIAPGAPKPEAFKFLIKCRSLRLNPLADEIFLVQMGSKWGTIVAKAGYLKRSQERPEYQGFEAGIVIQKIINAQKGEFGEVQEIEGSCLPKGWIVVGGWCRVYRAGHPRPYYISVGSEYYVDGSDAWKRRTSTMYRKVAVAQAHREVFAIGDSYDEAESPVDLPIRTEVREVRTEAQPIQQVAAIPAPSRPAPPRPAPPAADPNPHDFDMPVMPETLHRLKALIAAAALDPIELATMLERRDVRTGKVEDLDEPSAQSCIRGLEQILDQMPEPDDSMAANPEDTPIEAEASEPTETFVAGHAARREPRTSKGRKPKAEAREGEPAETVS